MEPTEERSRRDDPVESGALEEDDRRLPEEPPAPHEDPVESGALEEEQSEDRRER